SVVSGACAGGAAPGSGNTAIFDDTCSTNCSPSINAAIDVGGIDLSSGYGGTISQGAHVVTIETSYSQAGGTFAGGSSAIDLFPGTNSGVFTLSGGTFTSTSATMTFTGN